MVKIPFHDLEVIGRCHTSNSNMHMLKCVVFLLYSFPDMKKAHALLCFLSIHCHIFLKTLGDISFSLTPSVKCCPYAAQVKPLPKQLGWEWKDAAFQTHIISEACWVITEITWDFVIHFTWPIPSNRVSFLCSGSCI